MEKDKEEIEISKEVAEFLNRHDVHIKIVERSIEEKILKELCHYGS